MSYYPVVAPLFVVHCAIPSPGKCISSTLFKICVPNTYGEASADVVLSAQKKEQNKIF